MNITGKSRTIAMEMNRYGIQLLGIAEARWKDSGQMRSEETILYSGHVRENAVHSEGVAVMISQDALKTLIGWQPVSPRIMTAKFQTTNKNISLNIIQCYAPTNDADDETKEEFYQPLEETIRKFFNTGYEEVMGKNGIGIMNENGEFFASFCAINNLVIGGTRFPHKQLHIAPWFSPDMKTENQIDHVCISRKFWKSYKM